MELNTLLIYTQKAVSRLTDGWPFKIAVGGIIALVQFHLELITLFAILIVIDLLTKWLALAYEFIKTESNEPTVIDTIHAMPAAHRAGVISSRQMKNQFLLKMGVYVLVTIVSGIADIMISAVHHPAVLMELCISYLAASELLSIIENLNDAGVSCLAGLVNIVKRKTGIDNTPAALKDKQPSAGKDRENG